MVVAHRLQRRGRAGTQGDKKPKRTSRGVGLRAQCEAPPIKENEDDGDTGGKMG